MGIRLDKWLWAARFYKTRSIAREAVNGGKVHINGQRAKPSREVAVGMTVKLRQGYDEKTLTIKALSQQRGPASVAQTLYEETAESLTNREAQAAMRKALNANRPPQHKPDKKARRALLKIKTQQ
jgi:ribosome-associated heat shock protein Hsp15